MNFIKKRHELGLTQTEFWGHIGVTQAAASRYESATDPRQPDKQTQMLLVLAYGTPAQARKLFKQLRWI